MEFALNPKPKTLNPKPKPKIQNPKPKTQTQNPEPRVGGSFGLRMGCSESEFRNVLQSRALSGVAACLGQLTTRLNLGLGFRGHQKSCTSNF